MIPTLNVLKGLLVDDVQSFHLNQLNQLSNCGFQSVTLRNSRLCRYFPGRSDLHHDHDSSAIPRQTIQEDVWEKGNQSINRSIRQCNQFCRPIRELQLTPVFVFPGELPAALHQRQSGAYLQSVSPWRHVGGRLGRREDNQLPGEHLQADRGAQ